MPSPDIDLTATTDASRTDHWKVEGIWRGPQGSARDVRHFRGSRSHVERVLTRLEGKGRLLRRLSLQPASSRPG
ncbi:hypothetical protein [Ferrimonas balearica]|uniref:hypothetical protein n=2 Tax=Ferrimonas balearica TaxID=44012 RepID=UPI001C585DD9|nr:hypothetical protein [Ferrimonas balearica]MBW3165056.1 hypothetical protein [Ferrimonas balearica]